MELSVVINLETTDLGNLPMVIGYQVEEAELVALDQQTQVMAVSVKRIQFSVLRIFGLAVVAVVATAVLRATAATVAAAPEAITTQMQALVAQG